MRLEVTLETRLAATLGMRCEVTLEMRLEAKRRMKQLSGPIAKAEKDAKLANQCKSSALAGK
ncbi:hypothetical protein T484DRAFT_1792764 [Baffinella frigidus]|nr:hypothetical protein T484DRAFT_1792764 [Cryptophyta sp. CCMP2293]